MTGELRPRRYDPEQHHRASIRLKSYDYALAGAYFLTLCTYQRECWLARVERGETIISTYGRTVEHVWLLVPRHFPQVRLDAFVIMPNHLHAIVERNGRVAAHRRPGARAGHLPLGPVGSPDSPELLGPLGPHGAQRGSLAAVVQFVKSLSGRRINAARATPGAAVWQRNYYEHIVRDDKDLQRIRRYILDNAARWDQDGDNPAQWNERR